MSSKLQPERLWSVSVGDELIRIRDDRGAGSEVSLSQLYAVVVETNEGPFGIDWWLLDGADGLLSAFPWGAEGEEDAVRMLQDLPGFDHEKMALAIRSISNESFVIWKRQRTPRTGRKRR